MVRLVLNILVLVALIVLPDVYQLINAGVNLETVKLEMSMEGVSQFVPRVETIHVIDKIQHLTPERVNVSKRVRGYFWDPSQKNIKTVLMTILCVYSIPLSNPV